MEDVLNITQSAGMSILLRLLRVSFPTEKINKNCCVFTYLPTFLLIGNCFFQYQYFVFGNKIISNVFVKIKILHIAENILAFHDFYFQSSQQGQTDPFVVCDFRMSLES